MEDAGRDYDTGLRRADLDPDRPRPLDTPWGSMFLVESADGLRAVESWCPHLAAPLFDGSFHDGRVTCPWHGWVFDLASGRCEWSPDGRCGGGARLTTLAVREDPARGTLVVVAPQGPLTARRWNAGPTRAEESAREGGLPEE